MRALLVIVVVVLALVLIGWLQVSSPEGDPTIRVDTEQVEQDTESMINASEEMAEEAESTLSNSP